MVTAYLCPRCCLRQLGKWASRPTVPPVRHNYHSSAFRRALATSIGAAHAQNPQEASVKDNGRARHGPDEFLGHLLASEPQHKDEIRPTPNSQSRAPHDSSHNHTLKPSANGKRSGKREKQARPRTRSSVLGSFDQKEHIEWTTEEVDEFFACSNRLKESADAQAVNRLWQKAKANITNTTPPDEEIRSKIFARFLRIMFQLQQSDQATDVWNHMIAIGHPVGIRHWNAMLSGCGSIRDTDSLWRIWASMERAGLRPDNETWTTYIHGVMRSGNIKDGLRLLDQLGREWRSDTNSLIPGLGPVHGALSGISECRRKGANKYLPLIVTWARQQGLQLSTQTYNILLQPMVHTASIEEFKSFIATMQRDNCNPDVYTYTIIMKSWVGGHTSPFRSLSHDEQVSALSSILNDLVNQNIQPSPQTYSTLLFALLDNTTASPNLPAARLVLEHMAAAGIPANQHTITILITHFFTCTPPDIAAVENLVQSLDTSNRKSNGTTKPVQLNDFFYNRLISGYALAGEYEKALRYLRQMPREGQAPSWLALKRVLQALRTAEEWDLCREVVRGVASGETMRWGGSGVDGAGWTEWMTEIELLSDAGVLDGSDAEGSVRTD